MALKVAEVTNLGQLGELWIVTGRRCERLRRVVQRGREEAQLDSSSALQLDRLRPLATGCIEQGAGFRYRGPGGQGCGPELDHEAIEATLLNMAANAHEAHWVVDG